MDLTYLAMAAYEAIKRDFEELEKRRQEEKEAS